MPLSNPGFDLLTNISGKEYVEVKGTQAPAPRFLLTEGERRFAEENAASYLLVVVFGIDLAEKTHLGAAQIAGSLRERGQLRPIQWAGCAPGTY